MERHRDTTALRLGGTADIPIQQLESTDYVHQTSVSIHRNGGGSVRLYRHLSGANFQLAC